MILPQEYYQNQDVLAMARDLIGKRLVSSVGNKYCTGIIAETEAYRAPDDRACHAFGNRLTPRTKTMFEAGGLAYVYICYGMYKLINVVTGPSSFAHAVLIRALIPENGIDHMQSRRGKIKNINQLTQGPGALSIAMGIGIQHNACKLFDAESEIQIHVNPENKIDFEIISGKRVGVINSGECAHRPWRFFIKDCRSVSKWKP
ncbi:MAG: DNA-3-methyladenine glycosylase [Saprospiraceae bacterium]|nr:DNA-3-methyladenine glycosylase [Saprospiraceae bacterium]MBK9630036.1 DNA-3-methyladenine glycosylase [Saprospiraceae bacterium]